MFTDFILEIKAVISDLGECLWLTCYKHKEPNLISMARHYGVGYTWSYAWAYMDR